ncbi:MULTISPECIES: cobalamin biosynthesis protein CobG [unclassified Novosphingobium]|uniref:cobalamin biosynthesis protein CobG n=1 Tax=unclassified Novosphingobium TaxID=2644732 RepID=UPI001E58FC49|nr:MULTISPECIES: cobalamin biosynthesis protein CobG [unclassified Novosphingobium]MCW1384533.1 cobalamin biosynthesis protein CobG [Novosphingobium sp. KCTC 2891]
MSGFEIKGWCPDAWRPMETGDGLLVRIKPRLARLTRGQARALCALADRFGNGIIDVTRRANLQVRGVHETGWRDLVRELVGLGLVDADRRIETRSNLLVAPDWTLGDDSHRIACDLLARLGQLPDLPGKVGFVVDAGAAPALLDEPGDFRVERGATGGLILRAAGRSTGVELAAGSEAGMLIALAHWFHESGGTLAGRMARHDAPLPDWATGKVPPAPPVSPMVPGSTPQGTAHGAPFGQVEAAVLARAVADPAVEGLRITPWRVLLLEGTQSGAIPGLIADAADPLLRAYACPGAPFCPQANVATRELARRLAPAVSGNLHVSGCAKGCACPQPAAVVLTGRDGRFDLAHNDRAGSPAAVTDLGPAAVLAHFGVA